MSSAPATHVKAGMADQKSKPTCIKSTHRRWNGASHAGGRDDRIGFATPDVANRLYPTIASNDRADVVAAYLCQRGIVVKRGRGLGAARPLLGGDDTPAKVRNERVEIWLLDAGR
jgi:phosphate transport system substrate-binding protein